MTRLLNTHEQVSLDRALAKRTGRRVSVGCKPLTRAKGIALWNAAQSFDARPAVALGTVGQMEAFATPIRRAAAAAMLLAATASLGACATLGGNVKGDFACRAPDGICAPTSTIDDAALALIGGDGDVTPAGPYSPSIETLPRATLASAKPMRSGEKVLRIVFPAHIDGAGRFRETAAVHAVVERGAWMSAGAVAVQPSRAPYDDNPTTLPVEVSSVASRSLGELAASAPEARFPDLVAHIDADVARADAAIVVEIVTPAASLRPSSTVHPDRVTRSAMLPPGLDLATVPTAVSGAPPVLPTFAPSRASSSGAKISYSLPPQSQANVASPLDTIRAQVAGQLRASSSSAAPTVIPTAPVPSSVVGVGKVPTGPVNAPTRFPVSEVNR